MDVEEDFSLEIEFWEMSSLCFSKRCVDDCVALRWIVLEFGGKSVGFSARFFFLRFWNF